VENWAPLTVKAKAKGIAVRILQDSRSSFSRMFPSQGVRISQDVLDAVADVRADSSETNWYDEALYRRAENFRGRKLSRISEKYDFRRENFRGLLGFAAPKDATLQILRRKLSRIATKLRNSQQVFFLKSFPLYAIHV